MAHQYTSRNSLPESMIRLPVITGKMRYQSASVMDTGTNTMMLVYSEIKEGSLTIHLQNHYDRPFDRIRVGNKTYGVDFSRKLRTKQVYVVSEVV